MQESQKFLLQKFRYIAGKINKHINSFHALHSSLKMDRIDYTFKFSTELLVLVLSLLVIVLNFAGTPVLKYLNDSSLFAKELSYHPEMNQNGYRRMTAVRTVIDHQNPIIPEASAQAVLAADYTPAIVQGGTDSLITGNSIASPIAPDSVRNYITNEIKVYTTQPGDTLSSVANKFSISQNTIIWANNLQPNTTLKPGWDLLILPVNGILHKVTNNDTLPDIAKEFKANESDIISYNGLADDSDIAPGDMLIIPGGTVTPPPPKKKPRPSIKNVIHGKVYYEPAPGEVTDLPGDAHLFPWGQCTYYVAQRRKVIWGGNATNWWENAAAAGAKVGATPIVGAIAVFRGGRYGHVGLVEQVDGDNFLISEMNYKGRGIVDQRWINLGQSNIKGFIY